MKVNIWINNLEIEVYCQKHINNRNMMINNNPYNLPERPPNKPNRIYTENTNGQYRNDHVEQPTPYSQYLARHNGQHHIANKGSMTLEENTNYRQQYPAVRNDIKHYLPSPKSQNSSSNNLNNFIPTNAGRGSNAMGASLDKKASMDPHLRESFGTYEQPPPSLQSLSQRIESLSQNLRSSEKRISQLQKNSTVSFIPNNSKLNETDTNSYSLHNSGEFMNKYQNEWMDNFLKLKEEIQGVKDLVHTQAQGQNKPINSRTNIQIERIVAEKCKEVMDFSKNTQPQYKNSADEFKKQIDALRNQIQQRMKKNFDFLTSVIGRLQRQLHSCSSSMSTLSTLVNPSGSLNAPHFKPSAIKCSTTAILLRFIECFKVRKHGPKNGEIKITLADTTYYIDNEGYLLDKEQFYLVDSRDCRVRLEEQHLRLLKQEGILG